MIFSRRIDADLEIRPLAFEDTQQFFQLVFENREHLGRWMFWVKADYSLLDAELHITNAVATATANNGFESGIWVNGKLAGCIRYNHIDWVHKSTELRYWLGASFQGRGLAIRACRAFIDHAFRMLRLNRVEIRCMSENLRSRRIPEQLGFVQEGILRQVRWRVDHFDDHVVYGMLAGEWFTLTADGSKDD